MHILLIDDSDAYREEFAELLASGEFADSTLHHAGNAALGWQMMNSGDQNIIFVDYRMPGDNGLDLIRRARCKGIDRPFICLTGFDDPRIDLEAEQAGANGYLQKGEISAQLLTRTIRYAVRNAALVADLASARDAAQRASDAKSRFLAGMSHELRTPLNGILGYAQLLNLEGGLNATQSARVDVMLGSGKHLLQMITRVLDLSEIEAERVELNAVAFDVQAVAEACLDVIRPAAEMKGLVLSIALGADMQTQLFADPTRLRQILLNLLGNAAKFTKQGKIELRLRPLADGTLLRIEVADTGGGIPIEQRRRLFHEFGRLDTDATRAAEGVGLGLALSARLAKVMGGSVGHDDNPGGGSVFWLELPLNTQAESRDAITAAANGQNAHPAPSATLALRVLVVDDVLTNQDIAASFLRIAGHEVTCAGGGAEAVAMVASEDFDVVLMDVRMPQMDGLEATRRIRGLEGPRGQVPVVALTAQAFTGQVQECRDAGMDGHVAKPFDMDTLIAAVARTAAARPRPDVGPLPATMSPDVQAAS